MVINGIAPSLVSISLFLGVERAPLSTAQDKEPAQEYLLSVLWNPYYMGNSRGGSVAFMWHDMMIASGMKQAFKFCCLSAFTYCVCVCVLIKRGRPFKCAWLG